MEIKRAIETKDGTVFFQGTLQGAELEVVLSVGLNTLLEQGAIPFMMENTESHRKVVLPETDLEQ